MFEVLFGWRKTKKCKRLVKRVMCRLKLLKNKRESIVRQLREDIAQLIQRGQEHSAFSRVEQLCRDQNINAAYDLIEHYSEFILLNISYIRRNRDCPNDISEAVSSLIYASARCGDLPELLKLRKLFGERYGQKLSMCASELLAGNRVNDQIIEKLSTKSIADDVKYCVLRDIAANKNFQLEPKDDGGLAMEQHQVGGLFLKNCEPQHRHESTPIYSHKPNHRLNADAEPTVLQIAAAKLKPLHNWRVDEGLVELEKLEHQESIRKLERNINGEASESSSNLSDRSTIYPNDIEEFKPRINDVVDRDQRLFRFNSTPSHLANNHASTTVDEVCLSDHECDGGFTRVSMEPFEVYDGKTSSRASSRRRKSSRKRLRRRYHSSILLTSSSGNADHVLYYGQLVGCYQDDVLSQKSHHQRKYRKKMSVVESPSSSVISHRSALKASDDKLRLAYYLERTLGSSAFQHDMDIDCILKDVYQIMSPRLRSSSITSMKSSYKDSKLGAIGNENARPQHSTKEEASMSSATSTTSKSFGKVTSGNQMDGYHEMCYEAPNSTRVGFASHNSCSSTSSSSTQTILRPPYLRTMTMPLERPKAPSHQIIRSISCASQQSNHSSNSSSSSCSHVHPKLPNYIDLAIRFKALKEEGVQNSRSEVCIGLGRA
ncbi:hypothetical protein Sjap_000165 [Stephania japonica]|uniref:Uncharacterized protein n=1 Tax=Stephania japonica TaxID=461633 RepID=A0AAP0KK40_9MAGN